MASTKSPTFTLGMLFPDPEPVAIGDQAWLVSELRLGDVAALERALGRLAPHPLDGLPATGPDADPPGRRAIREARDRAADWPPAWGSPRSLELLGTFRGAATYLRVVLGRHNEIDDQAALDLAASMTAAEWEAIDRAAWGVDALEATYRAVAPELLPESTDPGRPDWGAALVSLATRFGIAPDRAARLTLRQVNCLLGDGVRMELRPEPPCPDEPPTGESTVDRHNARMRFWYDPDEVERNPGGILFLKRPKPPEDVPVTG